MAFRMRARTSVHTSPHYCAPMADDRSAELITLLSSESPAVEDGLLLLSQAPVSYTHLTLPTKA